MAVIPGVTAAEPRINHVALLDVPGLAESIPPIFLLVSAFLINMTLSRMVALKREQIGLQKASATDRYR
jgi:hypothetical protein